MKRWLLTETGALDRKTWMQVLGFLLFSQMTLSNICSTSLSLSCYNEMHKIPEKHHYLVHVSGMRIMVNVMLNVKAFCRR